MLFLDSRVAVSLKCGIADIFVGEGEPQQLKQHTNDWPNCLLKD